MKYRPAYLGWLAILVVLVGATTTDRHLTMVRSFPPKDSVITSVPQHVQVWFNEDPVVSVSRLWLEGDRGEVALGNTHGGEERSIVADIEGEMSAGTYAVTWRTAGDDGHSMRRNFEFTLAAEEDR